MAEQTQSAETQENPQKKSWGAKAVLAIAFSTVGAKISSLFSIADVSRLMNGEKKTFSEKLRGVWDGTLKRLMIEDAERNFAQMGGKTNWDKVKSYSKTFRYTLISTAVFMGGGAVLGWVRGDKVASVKDIFVHPIQSTKLVLGIGSKGKEAEKPAVVAQVTDTSASPGSTDAPPVKWTDRVEQQDTQERARA